MSVDRDAKSGPVVDTGSEEQELDSGSRIGGKGSFSVSSVAPWERS